MTAPLINLDQLQFDRDTRHGERFEAKFVPEGAAVDYWHNEA